MLKLALRIEFKKYIPIGLRINSMIIWIPTFGNKVKSLIDKSHLTMDTDRNCLMITHLLTLITL